MREPRAVLNQPTGIRVTVAAVATDDETAKVHALSIVGMGLPLSAIHSHLLRLKKGQTCSNGRPLEMAGGLA